MGVLCWGVLCSKRGRAVARGVGGRHSVKTLHNTYYATKNACNYNGLARWLRLQALALALWLRSACLTRVDRTHRAFTIAVF
mgnify:CR=1 FL=1